MRGRGAATLGRTGAKVGLTGFCLGGAVTIIGACRIPELAAGGVLLRHSAGDRRQSPPTSRCRCRRISPTRDDWCTPDVVDAFEKPA